MFLLKTIEPIAFYIIELPIYWYGIVLALAQLVGIIVCIREGRRFLIPQDVFFDFFLLVLPMAVIGARVYYVFFKWSYYKNHLWDIFKIWQGGIAIYGAIIASILCAIVFFRCRKYNFWKMADICAPALLVGQAIGRWGNFFNQEAYGGPVNKTFLKDTLHLPNVIIEQMNVNGVYHHPTFLYESMWSIVGVGLLFCLRRRLFLRVGELFLSYLVWYSIGRFYIEGMRTDSLAFHAPDISTNLLNTLWIPMKMIGFDKGYLDINYGNVRISQLIAVSAVFICVILIVVRRMTGRANERYVEALQ